jgi:hypothetical protein
MPTLILTMASGNLARVRELGGAAEEPPPHRFSRARCGAARDVGDPFGGDLET